MVYYKLPADEEINYTTIIAHSAARTTMANVEIQVEIYVFMTGFAVFIIIFDSLE
jgi:hypothetical protein